MFAPFAFLLMILFLALSLALLPFAYLSAIIKKIKLIVNVRGKFTKKKSLRVKLVISKTPWADLFMFIILGVPILIIATFKDSYNFLLLSYRKDVMEFGFDNIKEYILTEEQFENLEAFV